MSVANYDKNVEMNNIVLHKIKLAAAKFLSSAAVEDMRYEKREQIDIFGWVHEISMGLLASKIAEDHYTVYFYYKKPANWFQHLKLDKAPRWVKNRYPVKYTELKKRRTVKFTRYETYPRHNIFIPKNEKTIQLLGLERPIRDVIEEY